MNTNSNYLFIEPYVHTNINTEEILFYNTISGEHFILNDEDLLNQLKNIGFKNSTSILKIPSSLILKKKFINFITKLKTLFIGEVIQNTHKPFVFDRVPTLNNYSENNIDGEIDKNITESLFEINIFINSLNKVFSIFKDAHKQFYFPKVTMRTQQEIIHQKYIDQIINNIDNYYSKTINLIIGDIDRININLSAFNNSYLKTNFFLYYKTILEASSLELLDKIDAINIYISSDISAKEIEFLNRKLRTLKVTYLLIIQSENDFEVLEERKNKYSLNANYIPYFHKNESFFKENIYIEKEDILQRKSSLNEIHKRYLINTKNYGKLYITENGNVFSNMNSAPLGNLEKSDIKELIAKELLSNNSNWKMTKREVAPCKDCIYNCLCPPISNYELYIGKYNLCLV